VGVCPPLAVSSRAVDQDLPEENQSKHLASSRTGFQWITLDTTITDPIYLVITEETVTNKVI